MLNNLKFWQKLLLLVSLLLLPLLVMTIIQFNQTYKREVLFTQQQKSGAFIITKLLHFSKLHLEHRDLILTENGNATLELKTKLKDKERQINDLVSQISRLSGVSDLGLSERFTKLFARSSALIQGARNLDFDSTIESYNELIAQVLQFQKIVALESNLELEPSMSIRYLGSMVTDVVPEIFSAVGEIRAYGIYLTNERGLLDKYKTRLVELRAELRNKLLSLKRHLSLSEEKDADTVEVAEFILPFQSSVESVIITINDYFINEKVPTISQEEFHASNVIEQTLAFVEKLEPLLIKKLDTKLSSARWNMTWMFIGVSIAISLVLCFIYIFSRNMVAKLNASARFSEAISQGQREVSFDNNFFKHKDEFGRLFESLDKMLQSIVSTEKNLEQANQALNLESKRSKAVLNHAMHAHVGMDQSGVVTDWNPAAEKIFGWSAEEAIEKPMTEMIMPIRFNEQHKEGLRRFLETGIGPVINNIIEVSALRRDGSEFPIELAISAIKEPEGYLFSAFISDISEKKRLENEAKMTNKKLRRQNEIQEMLIDYSNSLRGASSLKDAGRETLLFLAGYIPFEVGAFYINDPLKKLLRPIGQFAARESDLHPAPISNTETLLGEAIFQNEIMTINEVPEDYSLKISSSLGECRPLWLTLIPVFHEGKPTGVIELGSLSKLSEDKLELLKALQEAFGIWLYIVTKKEQEQFLLKQTHGQREEMQNLQS